MAKKSLCQNLKSENYLWLITYGGLPKVDYLWWITYGGLPMVDYLWWINYGGLPIRDYLWIKGSLNQTNISPNHPSVHSLIP